MDSSSNNNITDNFASGNDQGIYLVSSSDYNTIYNNYFNNTDNAYDDGNNIWNLAKISGTNIVCGPYLGGNYWSDYAGKDLDDDSLGDTPYNISGGSNKDYLPLVEFIDLWIDNLKNIQTASAANWTVDDSGGADFTGIQEAINKASVGDTIIVHSGVYYENVVVDKSVTLKGIGHPVVDANGSGSAITLSADGITLVGFTATNSDSYQNAGINVTSNNNTITGNNASSNNNDGIYLEYLSNNNQIYLNDFINNSDNAYSEESTNVWNTPEKITYTYNGSTYKSYLGNYWDDYKEKYPDAEEIDSRGIWDTPYSIDGDEDSYPLMQQWGNYHP